MMIICAKSRHALARPTWSCAASRAMCLGTTTCRTVTAAAAAAAAAATVRSRRGVPLSIARTSASQCTRVYRCSTAATLAAGVSAVCGSAALWACAIQQPAAAAATPPSLKWHPPPPRAEGSLHGFLREVAAQGGAAATPLGPTAVWVVMGNQACDLVRQSWPKVGPKLAQSWRSN
eukprot:SAG11_NODE_1840_length_4183_cov_8.392018_1_plen_176_part_00